MMVRLIAQRLLAQMVLSSITPSAAAIAVEFPSPAQFAKASTAPIPEYVIQKTELVCYNPPEWATPESRQPLGCASR